MSYRQTFVIEYPDSSQVPQAGANMELLGGRLVACQFSDALEELEALHEADIPSATPTSGESYLRKWADYWRERALDAEVVLRMVDTNQRIDEGEKLKAWSGRFVIDEVRRVVAKAPTTENI